VVRSRACTSLNWRTFAETIWAPCFERILRSISRDGHAVLVMVRRSETYVEHDVAAPGAELTSPRQRVIPHAAESPDATDRDKKSV